MALTDEGGNMVMPVGPMYGNNNCGFGGDWGWIILLLLFAGGGNWGGMGGNNIYPWMNQANLTSNGFQNQLVNDNISAIRDNVNNVQMSNIQGFNSIQNQLAQCCCDNRSAIADLKYTVATENCADRQSISNGLRDLMEQNAANTQRVLDQMCNDKIDAKNDLIAQLRQELLFARGQASQNEQTAVIRAGQIAEVDALYDRLSNCPVPSVPVYGRQPIFGCQNNSGCGCSM